MWGYKVNFSYLIDKLTYLYLLFWAYMEAHGPLNYDRCDFFYNKMGSINCDYLKYIKLNFS